MGTAQPADPLRRPHARVPPGPHDRRPAGSHCGDRNPDPGRLERQGGPARPARAARTHPDRSMIWAGCPSSTSDAPTPACQSWKVWPPRCRPGGLRSSPSSTPASPTPDPRAPTVSSRPSPATPTAPQPRQPTPTNPLRHHPTRTRMPQPRLTSMSPDVAVRPSRRGRLDYLWRVSDGDSP